jgi:hypothetical protein
MTNVANFCGRIVYQTVSEDRKLTWTSYDTAMLLLLLFLIGLAVSFAASCEAGWVEYVVAVLFPVEYILIKLVTDCKGARGVVIVQA